MGVVSLVMGVSFNRQPTAPPLYYIIICFLATQICMPPPAPPSHICNT